MHVVALVPVMCLWSSPRNWLVGVDGLFECVKYFQSSESIPSSNENDSEIVTELFEPTAGCVPVLM